MPVGSISPFRPVGTMSIAASAASSNAALAPGGDTVVVTNASGSLAFVRFGADATVVASVADMPVLSNSKIVLSINSLISYAAAIIPSGSGTIMFSRGEGSIV
jgi:hypothetical protein